MTDKELKDWCKTCNVEPPAMRFKCPECEHNPDKEQIMINGVDVGGCRFYQIKANKLYPKAQYCGSMRNIFCEDNPNCYYKQLARKTQECEELLKENQQLRNSLSDSLMFKFTGQENETNRYRKALEEIEKVCLEDTRTFADGTQVRYDSLDEILDIINKAKGEGNGN